MPPRTIDHPADDLSDHRRQLGDQSPSCAAPPVMIILFSDTGLPTDQLILVPDFSGPIYRRREPIKSRSGIPNGNQGRDPENSGSDAAHVDAFHYPSIIAVRAAKCSDSRRKYAAPRPAYQRQDKSASKEADVEVATGLAAVPAELLVRCVSKKVIFIKKCV